MSNKIQHAQAAFHAAEAQNTLHEILTLRDVAQRLQREHDCPDSCEQTTDQIEVLANLAEEKLECLSDSLDIVASYFVQDVDADAAPQPGQAAMLKLIN